MSTPPYPLPPGCIFREDFRNPTLAAQNGLVITGNPWMASGIRMVTGTQISVPRLTSFNPNAVTAIFDAQATASNGQYKVCLRISGNLDRVYFGYDNNVNRLFWYDGTLRYSSNFTVGRRLFGVVVTGGTASWYQDGASLGTSVANLNKGTTGANVCNIGSTSILNNNLFTDTLYSLRLYSYAMSADEFAHDYRTIRGLQA